MRATLGVLPTVCILLCKLKVAALAKDENMRMMVQREVRYCIFAVACQLRAVFAA